MWSTLIFHVLLLSAGFGGDSIAYGQNPLCANFSKGKDVELNFRAALSFKRTLYFLTDDWEVYEIRGYREQLNRTRKVQLDGKSVPIELKWPSLAKHFAKFRDGPVSVFSTDFDIPIIYIDRKKECLTFNPFTGTLRIQQFLDFYWDKNDVFITGDFHDKYLHSISRNEDKMLKISYWELMEGFSVILDYRAYFLYYVDRGQTNKRDTIALTNMVLVERQMNGMTLIPIYDWQIIAGFFQDDYFYLIGSVHVYIFEAKSVQTHLSPIVFMSHLFIVPHADYFYCEHNLLPPNAQHWPANSSSSAEMATVNGTILTTDRSKESKLHQAIPLIIVAIAVILIVFIVIFLFTIYFSNLLLLHHQQLQRSEAKPKPKDSKIQANLAEVN